MQVMGCPSRFIYPVTEVFDPIMSLGADPNSNTEPRMKVKIYSEQTPNGQEADWPAIPPIGSYVRFAHRGGTDNLEVVDTDWNVATDGSFDHVEVRLTF